MAFSYSAISYVIQVLLETILMKKAVADTRIPSESLEDVILNGDNAVTGGFEVKKISKKRSAVDKNAWSG